LDSTEQRLWYVLKILLHRRTAENWWSLLYLDSLELLHCIKFDEKEQGKERSSDFVQR
jgi:hypothetical protein